MVFNKKGIPIPFLLKIKYHNMESPHRTASEASGSVCDFLKFVFGGVQKKSKFFKDFFLNTFFLLF